MVSIHYVTLLFPRTARNRTGIEHVVDTTVGVVALSDEIVSDKEIVVCQLFLAHSN